MEDLISDFLIYEFEKKKSWSFVSEKLRRQGQIVRKDSSVELCVTANVPKDYQLLNYPNVITASGTHQRIYLLTNLRYGAKELGKTKAELFFRPRYVAIQNFNSRKFAHLANNIAGDVPLLNEWFGVNVADYSYAERGFREKTDFTETIHLKNKNIIFSVSLDIDSDRNSIRAKNDCSVRIEYPSRHSFYFLIQDFRILESFFNLIFPTPNKTKAYTLVLKYTSGKDLPIIQRFYENERQEFSRPDEGYTFILFERNDLTNLGEVIELWFENFPAIEPVIENLMVLKTSKIGEVSRFMNIVSSLETLHRHFFNFKKFKKTEYREKKKRILESITTKEDRNFVEEKIRYGYEPTLSERVKHLYRLAVPYGVPQLGQDVINKIAPTRNYYTHFNKHLESKILKPHELVGINNVLYIYLRVLLLRGIGLKEDEIKKIVKNSSQLKTFYREIY